MKLRILSDLHYEFHRDGGASFISDQSDHDYDVMVLAGDITTSSNLRSVFANFRKAVGQRPIVYVPGNHEYYHSSPGEISRVLTEIDDPLLNVLDNREVTIDGVNFIGSTLWFPHSGLCENGDDNLSDFGCIDGFRDWVGNQARKSANFLNQSISPGCVVVTHHLPHQNSIHEAYKGGFLNKYFIHDVGPLVEDAGVKLWIHGHTHVSMDYEVNNTRVVCNPFGYLRHSQNSKFNEKLTINV